MAGASLEERRHLHPADRTWFRYLVQRVGANARTNSIRDEDANYFEQLELALKSAGLSKHTPQLVAAILHLVNIEFTVDPRS